MNYGVLGVLFINDSIGGSLTSFAAPPVLMVAATSQWNSAFRAANFGWKAATAVFGNASAVNFLLATQMADAFSPLGGAAALRVPPAVSAIHLEFLSAVMAFAHRPVIFVGLLLMLLGFAKAYGRYQRPLILSSLAPKALFLQRARPDRHHRERRADLPRLADRRHQRPGQVHAAGRRGSPAAG